MRQPLRRLTLLLTLLMTPVFSGTSLAADSTDEKLASKVLKDRGAAALARGEFALARDLFQQAYDTYPSPNLQFNLGLAFMKLGEEARGAEAFSRFLAESEDMPVAASVHAQAQIDAVSPRLGRLRITASVAGAEAKLDGRHVGKTPLSAPMWGAAGAHEVSVHKDGFRTFRSAVVLVAGQQEERQIALEPEPVVSAPLVAPAPRPGDRRPLVRRPWFWGVVVGGVVVVATAVTLGVVFGIPPRAPEPSVATINGN